MKDTVTSEGGGEKQVESERGKIIELRGCL